MFWFIIGALAFGAFCALGSTRHNHYYYDNREYEYDYDGGGGDCGGCDD